MCLATLVVSGRVKKRGSLVGLFAARKMLHRDKRTEPIK
jgi:hypothetical protein